MRGIILSGGYGTRLYPSTISISKQIIPLYDKPMIYYPLSVLMLSGIKEIMIISSKEHLNLFKKQFGNGHQLGITIEYAAQTKPNGIPESFIIAEDFINKSPITLILGDNFFYGQKLGSLLQASYSLKRGANIFLHQVNNPKEYGVVKLSSKNNIQAIYEKPKKYISNYAITGLYVFDKNVVDYTKKLKFSKRKELEITDLIKIYLKNNLLNYNLLGRGYTWFDAGTHDSLLLASQFIKAIEERQGFKIGCIEEISYINGWINILNLKKHLIKYKNSSYGKYLNNIIKIN